MVRVVGEAAEDVVEDGGGVCVIRVATRRVEQVKSRVEILLRFEELKEAFGGQVLGQLCHKSRKWS